MATAMKERLILVGPGSEAEVDFRTLIRVREGELQQCPVFYITLGSKFLVELRAAFPKDKTIDEMVTQMKEDLWIDPKKEVVLAYPFSEDKPFFDQAAKINALTLIDFGREMVIAERSKDERTCLAGHLMGEKFNFMADVDLLQTAGQSCKNEAVIRTVVLPSNLDDGWERKVGDVFSRISFSTLENWSFRKIATEVEGKLKKDGRGRFNLSGHRAYFVFPGGYVPGQHDFVLAGKDHWQDKHFLFTFLLIPENLLPKRG